MTRGFEHKGYVGVVEYDPEIAMFHGQVVDTKSAITFYGASVGELQREMAVSVDTYLEVCQEKGITPDKPYSGKLHFRLGAELHRELAVAAAAEGVSLNEWLVQTVSEKVGG